MACRQVSFAAPWFPQDSGMYPQRYPSQQPAYQQQPTFGNSSFVPIPISYSDFHHRDYVAPQYQEQNYNNPNPHEIDDYRYRPSLQPPLKNSISSMLSELKVSSKVKAKNQPSISLVRRSPIRKSRNDKTSEISLLRSEISEYAIEIGKKRNGTAAEILRKTHVATKEAYDMLTTTIDRVCEEYDALKEKFRKTPLEAEDKLMEKEETEKLINLHYGIEAEKDKKIRQQKEHIEALEAILIQMKKNHNDQKADKKKKDRDVREAAKANRAADIKKLQKEKKEKKAKIRQLLEKQSLDADEDDEITEEQGLVGVFKAL